MFYHVSIQQSIDLEPMYFGPKLRETICLKITDKVSMGHSNRHVRYSIRHCLMLEITSLVLLSFATG